MTDLKTNECCEKCKGEHGLPWCRNANCPSCHQTNEKEEWEIDLDRLTPENLDVENDTLYGPGSYDEWLDTHEHLYMDSVYNEPMFDLDKHKVKDFIRTKLAEAHQAGVMEGEKELLDTLIKAFLKRGKEQGDKTILWTGQEIVDVLNEIKFTRKE
jgi:hypothetical protein